MIRIVMLLCVGLLSACGQKAPLYFPPAKAETYTAPERSSPPEFPAPSEQPTAPAPDENAEPVSAAQPSA
ncbi:MAG: lipoprotein [Paraperlucidibaca sp.]